jgi:glucose-1-phosphatase
MKLMNFIFDMGGVLSLNVDVIPDICSYTGVSRLALEDFSGVDFQDMSEGRISVTEFWQNFNRHFGTQVQKDLTAEFFQPVLDKRMYTILSTLKSTGHHIVCGTNTIESHYRTHRNRGDYSIFDSVYASYLMGITKPDITFFQFILQAEDWSPDTTVFVDDNSQNTQAAHNLGLNTWTYSHTPSEFQDFIFWLRQIVPDSFMEK